MIACNNEWEKAVFKPTEMILKKIGKLTRFTKWDKRVGSGARMKCEGNYGKGVQEGEEEDANEF